MNHFRVSSKDSLTITTMLAEKFKARVWQIFEITIAEYPPQLQSQEQFPFFSLLGNLLAMTITMALRMAKSCGFRLVKQTTLHLHLTFFVHYFAVLAQPAM